MPQSPDDLTKIESLERIVADLRGPQGCPWDKEQTTQTLTPYLIEECFELVDALESGDSKAVCEELGDLLFQIALHSQLAAENNEFTIKNVIECINSKMLRRHPHVFGEVKVRDSAEVIDNWEKIKKLEKKNVETSPLQVPKGLPSLQRSFKIGKRTEKLKFDWENYRQVIEKVEEEIAELKIELNEYERLSNEKQKLELASNLSNRNEKTEQNGIDLQSTQSKVSEELGDLLFSIAQLARHLELEPEQVLRQSNHKFERRFEKLWQKLIEKKQDLSLLSQDEKEKLWSEVKIELKS